MSASNRWLILIAAVTALLIGASLAVASLVDREVEYDIATPEGTVQVYLRAVADRDATAAFEFYSADLRASCEIAHLRDSLQWRSENFRASLRDVIERDATVEVSVAIVETYGSGPFDRGESTFNQVFVLTAEDGGWRFVEVPWPSWCPTPATSLPGLPGTTTDQGSRLWG